MSFFNKKNILLVSLISKIAIVGILLSVFLLGCNFASNDLDNKNEIIQKTKDEPNKKKEKIYTISGSISSSGALPSEIYSNHKEFNAARTATPQARAVVFYIITAESITNPNKSYTTTATLSNPSFSIKIPAGKWNFSVEGFAATTKEQCSDDTKIFATSGSTLFDTEDENPSLKLSVSPITKSGTYGYVSLSVAVEDNSKVKSGEASWKGLLHSNTGSQLLDFTYGAGGSSGINFNSSCNPGDLENHPYDIQSDIYEVTFTFYSGTNKTGTVVYKCTEIVNVFQNMTTDTWVSVGTSSYISDSGFSITNDCLSSYERVHYYINGVTGNLDSTVSGILSDPFKNLEQANNYITTNTGDLRKEKTIYFHVGEDCSYSQPVTLADYKELVIIGENETSQKEQKKIRAQGFSTGDLFINSNVKLDNIILEKAVTVLELDSTEKKLTLCNSATVNCSIKIANSTSKIYVDCSDYSDLSINLSYETRPNKGEPIVYPLSGTLSSDVTDKFIFASGNANILYDAIKNVGVFNRETDIYFNANSSESVANGSKEYPFKTWKDVRLNVEAEDTVYLMSDVSDFSGILCPVKLCSYQDDSNPTAVYSVNTGTASRINFQSKANAAPTIVENINIDGNNKELWLSGSVNSGGVYDYGVIFKNCKITNVSALFNSAMVEFNSTDISGQKYYCGIDRHSTFNNSKAVFNLFSLTQYNSGTPIKLIDSDVKAWATFDSSSYLYADFINISEPDSLTVCNLPQPVSAVDPVASVQNYTFVNYSDAVAGTTLINYTGSTVPDLSKLTAGNCSTYTSGTNYTIIQNPSDSTKLCTAVSLKYFVDKNSTAKYSNGSEFAPAKNLDNVMNEVNNITLASPADVIEIYLKSDSANLSVSALPSFNKNLKICSVQDEANPDAMYKIDFSITTSTASTASPTIELENVLIVHGSSINKNPLINMKKGTLTMTNVVIENNITTKSLVTMTSGNLIMNNVTIENKATGFVRTPLYLGSGTTAELNSVDINGFVTDSSQYSDSKGAIYSEGSLNYKDGVISECGAQYKGAGITLSGSANSVIENVKFLDCYIAQTLTGNSTGISQGGANIHVGDTAQLTIKGSTCGTVTKTNTSTENYTNDIALTKNSAANFKVEGLTSDSVCNLTLTTNFAVGDVLFNVLGEYSNTENLFTIVYPADNGWVPKYASAGKTCVVGLAETIYTDWASLVAAVESIPSETTEETEFVISGTLNADSELINLYPIKITGKTGKSADSIQRKTGYNGRIFNPLKALTLENISINGNNVADSLSVIYACDVDLSLNEVEFSNCKTTDTPSSSEAVVCICESQSLVPANINIKNTNFDNIASNYYGGAILCSSKNAKVILENISATNCSAVIGGFMYIAAGDVRLSGVYIDCCSTTGSKESGGAICVLGGDSKLTLKCPEENNTYGIKSQNNTIVDDSILDIAIIQSSSNGCPEFIIDGNSFIQKIYYYVDTQPEKPIYLNIDAVEYPIELEFSKTDFATSTYPVMQSASGATCSLADGVACFTVVNSGWSINDSGFLVSAASTPISGLVEAPTAGTFSVSSVEEFNQLSSWVVAGSTMENVTLVIDTPVSITGTWTPIGTDTHPFKGTFDGGGQTISLDDNHGGLFGNVKDATIKNINLTSSVTGNDTYVGGLIGKGAGVLLIENCTMDGYFSTNSASYVGGIIGYVDGSSTDDIVIRNCFNKLGVNGSDYVGGIVGYISEIPHSVRIENCGNRGVISNTVNGGAGGILGGTVNTNVSIVNCFSQASITPGTNVGSIVGKTPDTNAGEINYCYIYITYAGAEPSSVSYVGTGVGFSVGSNCNLFTVDSRIPKVVINKTCGDTVTDLLNNWCTTNGSAYKLWTYDADGNIKFVD